MIYVRIGLERMTPLVRALQMTTRRQGQDRYVRIKASSMYPELRSRLKSQCMIYVRIIRGPHM